MTLLTEGMAGFLMARGEIQSVIVGADRIARNGDVANKIGTYTLAVLAHTHRIPMFVAAPRSTLDLALSSGAGSRLKSARPMKCCSYPGAHCAAGAMARHPAFDVTPAQLVTAIITDAGVARPPWRAWRAWASVGPAPAATCRRWGAGSGRAAAGIAERDADLPRPSGRSSQKVVSLRPARRPLGGWPSTRIFRPRRGTTNVAPVSAWLARSVALPSGCSRTATADIARK